MRAAASTRALVLTVVGAAVIAFLMSAAASAIVDEASSSGSRELEVQASSIVGAREGEAITDAPIGTRVPQLIEVQTSDLSNDATAPALEPVAGVRTVPVGIIDAEAVAFGQQLSVMSEAWNTVQPTASKRIRNAATAAGSRLRKRGIIALILPSSFMSVNPDACEVAIGFENGGVIPVIRLAAENAADFTEATACLNRLKNRNPTVYVDARNKVQAATAAAMKGRTSLVDTSSQRAVTSIEAGAAILFAVDAARGSVIELLTAKNSKASPSSIADAASRAGAWLAEAPTPGAVPATTAAEAKRRERAQQKLDSLKKIPHAKSDPQNDADDPGRSADPNSRSNSGGASLR